MPQFQTVAKAIRHVVRVTRNRVELNTMRPARCVQKLNLLQIVQVAEPVAEVLAAALAPRAGPSSRFDCC